MRHRCRRARRLDGRRVDDLSRLRSLRPTVRNKFWQRCVGQAEFLMTSPRHGGAQEARISWIGWNGASFCFANSRPSG